MRDGPKWFKVTNGCHGTIYCSSTLLPAVAFTLKNDTLAIGLASRMKVTTTVSWLSMPKSSYKKLCYNILNNSYWHEKGLAENFDLPQQILTCQRNRSFILKQAELLFVHRQLHKRNSVCNIATNISISILDGQCRNQTIDALWNHQSWHQHSLVMKLWNTFFTQWS